MDDEEEKTRVNHRGAVTNELRKPRREDKRQLIMKAIKMSG